MATCRHLEEAVISRRQRVRDQRPSPKNRCVVSREQILETTLEALAEKGFRETSLASIARRLGVTAPLLIYHFDSKDNLWREAISLSFTRLSSVVKAAASDGASRDGHEAMRILLRSLIFFFAYNRELHRIIVMEAASPSPRLLWLIENHLRPMFTQIEAVYNRGSEDGSLKAMPVDYALFSVLGSISNYIDSRALVAALYGRNDFSEGSLDEYADFVIDVCFNGLAAHNHQVGERAPLRAAV